MYGQARAQLWGAVERGVSFYVLCTSIYQHIYIEPIVVCAAFVTLMGVLLFMPKTRISLAYTPLIASVRGT